MKARFREKGREHLTFACSVRGRLRLRLAASASAEPPVSAYAEGLRKLARLGTLLISLAGGEPLLRADIPDIVAAVGRLDPAQSRLISCRSR